MPAQRKQRKVQKVMREWAAGRLHSGSKHGPKVPRSNPAQAVAIALREAGVPRKKKGRAKKKR